MAKAFALLLMLAGAAAFVLGSVMPYPIEIDWTTPESQLGGAAAPEVAAVRIDRAVPSDARLTSAPQLPARIGPPEVVTLAYRAAEPVARTTSPSPPRAVPFPGDRVSLARELQREFRRVGCYDGEINGVWTSATRRAAQAFTERMNATLPNDEPDFILLKLVQDQQDKVCGASCPAGQALTPDGRCVPTAVLGAWKAPQAARLSVPPVPAAGPAIIGQSGRQLQRSPALTDDQPSQAGPGPLGLLVPAAPAGVSPAPSRSADPARARAQVFGFGPTVFRQVEKNGF
jgi:hypothetical protein